jgi:hypothetical protein
MALATFYCDWTGCPIVARFHIEVPRNPVGKLNGEGTLRLPFSHTHHNICAAHLDEYSATKSPIAIHHVGKCPHCHTV